MVIVYIGRRTPAAWRCAILLQRALIHNAEMGLSIERVVGAKMAGVVRRWKTSLCEAKRKGTRLFYECIWRFVQAFAHNIRSVLSMEKRQRTQTALNYFNPSRLGQDSPYRHVTL